jgi:AcrR family transcriptional regulator
MITQPDRRGRPRDEGLQERRQEEILDVAIKLFADRGYPNTDVQQVADVLNVGKGTIYRYFPSKEQLFLKAVRRGISILDQQMEQYSQPVDGDPLLSMQLGIQAYLQFFKDRPEIAELLIQERAEFRDRVEPAYFEIKCKSMEPWVEKIQGLIASGRVRQVPVTRILDVLGDLLYGTMFTNHFSGRHKPVEEQVNDIIDVVFNGILTEPERQKRSSLPANER